MVASSLKSFIKDVRGAKTLADERSIITKQSAKIRTKLRDDRLSNEKKRVNIQKLLYLYILGEKTHFGQVESINLIASDNFIDKRLGYLATILLLDESQDLLTLLTNMLNNDLQHPNKYIVALALTTLGCLSSTELARDLYPDVENILKNSSDPFLLKKALQCNAKLIQKDRSLLEIFPVGLIGSKLIDSANISTHGVLLGVCKVLQAILITFDKSFNRTGDEAALKQNGDDDEYQEDVGILKTIAEYIQPLSYRLSTLNAKSLEPSYDIQGIQDPFLQCELLVTLKWFFKIGNNLGLEEITKHNNAFNDRLTQIATNTSALKNPGNAILYEVTRTIFELKLTEPLRVLGINILANFLAPTKNANNTSNNVKYVGLNTLISVVPEEPKAVQRYREFISQCLYDYDISIKFRALELTFAILDGQNFIELTSELMNFLEKISKSHYNYATSYIDLDDSKDLILYTVDHLLEKFEVLTDSDDKTKLDALMNTLKMAGSFIDLDRINEFIIAINNIDDLKYKISLLSQELAFVLDDKADTNIDSNACLELTLVWCIGEYADLIISNPNTNKNTVNEKSIIKFLSKLNNTYRLSRDSKMIHYILTAALKLSTKINDRQLIEDLRQIIISHSADTNLMIQTKSIHYELLFNQPNNIKKQFLQAMPKFEKKTTIHESNIHINNSSAGKPAEKQNDLLLDLLNDTELGKITSSAPTTTETPKSNDVLADLLTSSTTNKVGMGAAQHVENIQIPTDCVLIHQGNEMEVYEKTIDISPGLAHLELFVKAKKNNLGDIQPLCAVPKTQKITLSQLQPTNSMNAGGIVKQSLKINGSGKLKLRIKLSFHVGNSIEVTSEQFDYKLEQTI